MEQVVPASHMRTTIQTAKHIDVSYHLKIRAMLEGGDEIAIDHWPMRESLMFLSTMIVVSNLALFW